MSVSSSASTSVKSGHWVRALGRGGRKIHDRALAGEEARLRASTSA